MKNLAFTLVELLMVTPLSVPDPLSDRLCAVLRGFLSRNGIPANVSLESARVREGRCLVFFHYQGLDYALKCFDPKNLSLRPAFEREKHFYRLLKSLNTHQTPILIACGDEEEGMLLLSRISGRGFREREINQKAVQQAADFLVSVNRVKDSEIVCSTPMALGVCCSISDHLNAGAEIVDQTQQYHKHADVPTLAFLNDELEPIWQKVLGAVLGKFQTASIDVLQSLPQERRILSPGNFGFHNALLTPEKEVCFVDFAQSGWEDPARLINQFFCFGSLPPKIDHWETFIRALQNLPFLDPEFAVRAKILLPVYQVIRSCMLVLKCFPTNLEPSGGVMPHRHSKIQLAGRLIKARQWLIQANRTV